MFVELLAPLTAAVFRLLLGICFDWLETCMLFFLLISGAFPLLVILMLTALSSPLLIYAVVLYWFGPGGFLFKCFGGLFRLWSLDTPAAPPGPLLLTFREQYLFVVSSSSSPSSHSTSPLLPDVEFEEVRHYNKDWKIRVGKYFRIIQDYVHALSVKIYIYISAKLSALYLYYHPNKEV